jgi:hypothetical protein
MTAGPSALAGQVDQAGALVGVRTVDTAFVLRRGKAFTEEVDRPENAKYIPLITLCA